MLRHPVSFAARGLCRHFPNTMPAPTRRFVADSCNSKAQKESRLADQTLCSNGDGWTRHLIPSCAWELQAPDTLNLPPANNLELWLPNDKRVFDPTPATLATVQSLVQERELWAGKDGIDWGTGKLQNTSACLRSLQVHETPTMTRICDFARQARGF